MSEPHFTGQEAINALREDFAMLLSGEWTPEPNSIDASVRMLDRIEGERNELIKALQAMVKVFNVSESPDEMQAFLAVENARAQISKATTPTK